MNVKIRGRKYKEVAEWAYDMIAASPGVPASEMAELMAERFSLPKVPMTHLLASMVKNNLLMAVGRTKRNKRMTYQLAIAVQHKSQKRKDLPEFSPQKELPFAPPPKENPFMEPGPLGATPPPVVVASMPPWTLPSATKTINGTSAPMIVVQTVNGPMFLTGAQAKEIVSGIKAMFE